ncbi:MAG: hypothetical protein ILP10_00735 [Lachnospiraceae bacterium]|nr:hypothetical protein [Lachnospiraceae bacterium]
MNKDNMNTDRFAARNRIEISVKGLMLAVVVVIACILSAISLYMVNRGKSSINSGNNQYSAMMSDFTELDKTMYDGLEVSGDEVLNVIASLKNDEAVKVTVKTLENQNGSDKSEGSSYGCGIGGDPTNVKSNPNYINPSASFKGSVEKNENGIVTTILFVQQ